MKGGILTSSQAPLCVLEQTAPAWVLGRLRSARRPRSQWFRSGASGFSSAAFGGRGFGERAPRSPRASGGRKVKTARRQNSVRVDAHGAKHYGCEPARRILLHQHRRPPHHAPMRGGEGEGLLQGSGDSRDRGDCRLCRRILSSGRKMQRRTGRRGRGGGRHLRPLLVGDGRCCASDVLLVRVGGASGGRIGKRGTLSSMATGG